MLVLKLYLWRVYLYTSTGVYCDHVCAFFRIQKVIIHGRRHFGIKGTLLHFKYKYQQKKEATGEQQSKIIHFVSAKFLLTVKCLV